ncbi:hypothetical protein ACJA88_002269 [Fusarium oxysporum]
MKQSFVLPPHVEDVRRCLTDFSCLSNEKDESFHTISKDIEEGMERDLNPDPIRKAAERIQHEVLSKVGGGYAENVWQDIFGKRLFDQLTDSPSLSRDDSRRVSRSMYYYDQVIRSSDEIWTIFEPGKEATTSRLRPVKCPKPDQAFFFPVYHHRNNSGLPKVADPKARQRAQAWDSRPVEPSHVEYKKEKDQNEALEHVINCQGVNAAACATNLVQQTAQYAAKLPRHAHIPPIPVVTTVGPSVTVWLIGLRHASDLEGDVKNLTDIMTFQMIIENTHTWAIRVFKPLIVSYMEQWKHIHSGQKTGMVADLLPTAKSEAFHTPAGMELDDMAHKKVTPLFLDDSDYHPTSSESRSRSPSDAHTDDGDAQSEVAVSVASTSAFSFSSFSKDTTVVWRPPSDPETPKAGSSSKKGSERPDILHGQSSQPSEDSDDATPKPTTVGHGIDFNFASPISGSPLERLGKNALDGPPVFAGRSPPGQPKWPPGRKFVSPKTQSSPKAPMHRGDIIPSPPADPKAKLYIDLTSDSQRDHPNTKE